MEPLGVRSGHPRHPCCHTRYRVGGQQVIRRLACSAPTQAATEVRTHRVPRKGSRRSPAASPLLLNQDGRRALCGRLTMSASVTGAIDAEPQTRGRRGQWSHCRRHRSDGYCDGCDRLHAPQELTLGSCWSHCDHIGTQHERPRGPSPRAEPAGELSSRGFFRYPRSAGLRASEGRDQRLGCPPAVRGRWSSRAASLLERNYSLRVVSGI